MCDFAFEAALPSLLPGLLALWTPAQMTARGAAGERHVYVGIGCAHFLAGHYAEAARWQEQGLRLRPTAFWVHRTLCPAYVQAGAMDQARRSANLLRKCYPDLTVSQLRLGMPPLPTSYGESIVGALSETGLPA